MKGNFLFQKLKTILPAFIIIFFVSITAKAQPFDYLPGYAPLLERIHTLWKKDPAASLKLSDSVEPLIKEKFGDTAFFYGYFVTQNPAIINESLWKYSKAESEYKRGMAIMKNSRGQMNYEYAEALNNIGNLYKSQNHFDKSNPFIDSCREILIKTGSTHSEAFAAATKNSADINLAYGNFLVAEGLYFISLDIINDVGKKWEQYHHDLYSTYNSLGALYNAIGNFEKAYLYYIKAIDEGKQGAQLEENSPQYFTVKNNAGIAILNAGRTKEALVVFREIQNTFKSKYKLTEDGYITATCSEVGALVQMKKTSDAKKICEDVLKANTDGSKEKSMPLIHLKVNYASILMQEKKWDAAIQLLENLSKEISQPGFGGVQLKKGLLVNLATIYLINKEYNKAILLADTIWQMDEKAFAENYKGLAEKERLMLVNSLHSCNMIYTGAFYSSGMKDNMLANKIFEKTTTYRGLLLQKESEEMESIRHSENKESKELYNEFRKNNVFLAEQYNKPENKRSKLKDSIENANYTIEKKIKLVYKTETIDIQDIFEAVKSKLKNTECAIEFIRFNALVPGQFSYTHHYGAFVITTSSKQPEWIYLGNEDKLIKIIGTSQSKTISNLLMDGIFIHPGLKEKGIIYPDEKLFAFILKPLLTRLENIKTVYCISDGLIAHIPLEALPLNRTKYVIDRFDIKNMLALRDIVKIKTDTAHSASMFITGDIDYGGNKTTIKQNTATRTGGLTFFDALEWSALEMENIKKIIKKEYKYDFLSGKKATEDVLKKQFENHQYDIVHFSTHGYTHINRLFLSQELNIATTTGTSFSNELNPLLSCGLAMAGANNNLRKKIAGNNEGLLTGYEIANTNLSTTKLVVLSACETGLGRITQTEGIYGLQRAFKIAGAKKIIMSLWNVNDKATSFLMIAFYKNVAAGNDFAAALKKAKIETRKEFPSPTLWGGFILLE